ncbi:hypothetical protein MVES1_000222 [Malassezia vespertilionis]|uniref:Uncharacterized protein n=1 Tax=Malassezia vespertilionis TaxID=2020962 RepID=A0A2N1JG56_9BASI|nr:uncharacterized protein MVES1_000222 [Malassezia vespertilionis]PKI85531.1 hypothetical protein MVES_000211 [Malassezia vespertilionis]WFD04897.1 hypothetical protein MVES1_000222 [Malassezia vespertilionis]
MLWLPRANSRAMRASWRASPHRTLATARNAHKPLEARVVYRGSPYMRKTYFFLAGACFVLAGLNFGSFIQGYLSWPLFSHDPQNPPQLVRKELRITAATGTVLISSLCGWYFLYAPSRMVTRMTIYPQSNTVGVRTASASPARWLPKSVKAWPLFQRAGHLSTTDPRERILPLHAIYRLQGSAVGSEQSLWQELAKKRVKVPHGKLANITTPKQDMQDTLMLRVGGAKLAFQLSAMPQRTSVLDESPSRGIRGLCQRAMRSPTDWGGAHAPGAGAAERAEYARRQQRGFDCEPWFLDRTTFDQLFPLDVTRYKQKK